MVTMELEGSSIGRGSVSVAFCFLLFGEGFDVVEDPAVDAVNDHVAPDAPVRGRPDVVAIPGGAFKASFIGAHFDKNELPAFANEEAIEVRRINLTPGRALFHGRRLAGHGEFEVLGLVPNFDGLNEGTGGEDAVTNRADAVPFDLGTEGIRDAQGSEEEVLGLGELGEGHDILPDFFLGGVNINDCFHFDKRRLRGGHMLGAHEQWGCDEHGHVDIARLIAWSSPSLKTPSQCATNKGKHAANWRRHQNTKGSFNGCHQQEKTKDRDRDQGDRGALNIGARFVVAVEQHRRETDEEGNSNEEAQSILFEEVNREDHHKDGGKHCDEDPEGRCAEGILRDKAALRRVVLNRDRGLRIVEDLRILFVLGALKFKARVDLGGNEPKDHEEDEVDEGHEEEQDEPERQLNGAQSADCQGEADPDKGQGHHEEGGKELGFTLIEIVQRVGVSLIGDEIIENAPSAVKVSGRDEAVEVVFDGEAKDANQ